MLGDVYVVVVVAVARKRQVEESLLSLRYHPTITLQSTIEVVVVGVVVVTLLDGQPLPMTMEWMMMMTVVVDDDDAAAVVVVVVLADWTMLLLWSWHSCWEE